MTKSAAKSHQNTKSVKRSKHKKTPLHATRLRSGESKHDRVLRLLRAQGDVTTATIMNVTGWQPHSVRCFLAGIVRKKLGLNLVSEQTDRGRVYRIKDGKASPAAAGQAKEAT